MSACGDVYGIHQSQHGLACRHGDILNRNVSLTISCSVLHNTFLCSTTGIHSTVLGLGFRVSVIIDVIWLQSAAITAAVILAE